MNSYPITDSSIVDLVLYFAESIANGELSEESAKIPDSLAIEGFSRQQLEYAYSLVMDSVAVSSRTKRPIRIFSSEELEVLSPEAATIFIKLNQLGIIDNEQVEIVLMRAALTPETRLSENELKMMIAMMLNRNAPDIPKGVFIPEDKDILH